MATKRILIVEDEEIARVLYKRLLDRMSHRYEIVSSIAEARGCMAKAGAYDLLVTDVRLPDGRGPELLPDFHAKYPAARMLVITGSPDLSDKEEPYPVPGVERIYKPFEIEEFTGALERLLK